MIRLLIVDDHEPTRAEAISNLSAGGIIQVVGQAETSDEGWKTAEKLLPDILLLDLHLPGLLSTQDLLKRLKNLARVKTIIYASQAKAADVQDLLDAGASAYVLKTDPPALLRMTIVMVQKGSKGVISPSLPRHITRLNPQERNMLRHLTKRGRLPQIAERMGMSEEGLKEAIEVLAEKLELKGAPQLVKWAKKHGF